MMIITEKDIQPLSLYDRKVMPKIVTDALVFGNSAHVYNVRAARERRLNDTLFGAVMRRHPHLQRYHSL